MCDHLKQMWAINVDAIPSCNIPDDTISWVGFIVCLETILKGNWINDDQKELTISVVIDHFTENLWIDGGSRRTEFVDTITRVMEFVMIQFEEGDETAKVYIPNHPELVILRPPIDSTTVVLGGYRVRGSYRRLLKD